MEQLDVWAIAAVAAVVALVGGGLGWRLRKRAAPSQSAKAKDVSVSSRGLFGGLRRTRELLRSVLGGEVTSENYLQLLEEALVTADVGLETTHRLLQPLAGSARLDEPAVLRRRLAAEMLQLLSPGQAASVSVGKPHVIVMIGVNGVGKTTSIAKLAHWYKMQGQRVLLVAADTFRAAASEQLAAWATRLGVHCVRHRAGADPAAVVFDGLEAARSRDIDVVIIDTAGRLHSKSNLVQELQKLARTAERRLDGGTLEVLLAIDATTGQNGLAQARVFAEALPVGGICLTKLDGTAKGGVVLSIVANLGIPIRFVGFGERLGDWDQFQPEAFVNALLGDDAAQSGSPSAYPSASSGAPLSSAAS